MFIVSENEQELKEREEFARTCFETLLQFSMLEDIESLTGVEGKLNIQKALHGRYN